MMISFLISQLSREPCPWLTGRAASHTPPIMWSATTASTLPPGAGVLITLLDKYSHFLCSLLSRSGWNISCQVARRGEQALKLAMVAGAALLPGPVRVLGNNHYH